MDIFRLYKYPYKIPSKGFIVDWESEDMKNDPQQWTTVKKIASTTLLSGICFLVTLSSSMGAGTYHQVSEQFNVTLEVAAMVTSLFLVGFGIGAPILAPLCEEMGRLPIYIVGMLLFSCFQIGAATSKNIESLIICRFFAGFFGTTPLSNAGGSLADIWTLKQLSIAFPCFGVCGFLGPCLGPVISSYISASYLGWRWVHYISAIIGFFCTFACFFFMSETYKPIIMDYKAKNLRTITKILEYKSLHEVSLENKSIISFEVLTRPLYLFITEPIVTSFTIIISITYIILFCDFESFSIIFNIWGFSNRKSSLPFLSMTVGIMFTFLIVSPISYYFLSQKMKKIHPDSELTPENRLIPLMFCCWGIPVCLFWVSWTTYASISPWPTIVAMFFFGIGMMQVFYTSYLYIIDSYRSNSASALSALTLIRYNCSAGMTHISRPMFDNLGVHWASMLLGFLSLIICAVPFVFWIMGPKLRSYSKLTE